MKVSHPLRRRALLVLAAPAGVSASGFCREKKTNKESSGQRGVTLTLPGCYLFTDSSRLIWGERHKKKRIESKNKHRQAQFTADDIGLVRRR